MLLVPSPVHAPVAGGTVSGTLSGLSGALVPNAQLSIKNLDTGVTEAVKSDALGSYTAPISLPSIYEVAASASGLATESRIGVALTVGAQLVLNMTIRVAQISEKVQVTNEFQPNRRGQASVMSGTETAASERAGLDLTRHSPTGVNSVASLQPSVSSGFERGARGFGVQMAIPDARPQYNSYRIDGVNVNDYVNGGPGSVFGESLGVGAIQELSLLTSNHSTEYGT
jgi:hypothetical protein